MKQKRRKLNRKEVKKKRTLHPKSQRSSGMASVVECAKSRWANSQLDQALKEAI